MPNKKIKAKKKKNDNIGFFDAKTNQENVKPDYENICLRIRLMKTYSEAIDQLETVSAKSAEFSYAVQRVLNIKIDIERESELLQNELSALTEKFQLLETALKHVDTSEYPLLFKRINDLKNISGEKVSSKEIETLINTTHIPKFVGSTDFLNEGYETSYKLRSIELIHSDTQSRLKAFECELEFLKKTYAIILEKSILSNKSRACIVMLALSIQEAETLLARQQQTNQISTSESIIDNSSDSVAASLTDIYQQLASQHITTSVQFKNLEDQKISDKLFYEQLEIEYATEKYDIGRRWNDCRDFIESTIEKLQVGYRAQALSTEDKKHLFTLFKDTLLYLQQFRNTTIKLAEISISRINLIRFWEKLSERHDIYEPIVDLNEQSMIRSQMFKHILYPQKNFVEAKKCLHNILKDHPTHIPTIINLIIVYNDSKRDLPQGEILCNRLIKQMPWLGQAHFLKTVNLIAQNKIEEARESLCLAYDFKYWCLDNSYEGKIETLYKLLITQNAQIIEERDDNAAGMKI